MLWRERRASRITFRCPTSLFPFGLFDRDRLGSTVDLLLLVYHAKFDILEGHRKLPISSPNIIAAKRGPYGSSVVLAQVNIGSVMELGGRTESTGVGR